MFLLLLSGVLTCHSEAERPNILIAISDDQSYPHSSAYGCEFIQAPAFDRIAREGALFTNAFVPSPGCAPSRASLVLGRYPWQNEHAGNHSAIWPNKFAPFVCPPRSHRRVGVFDKLRGMDPVAIQKTGST